MERFHYLPTESRTMCGSLIGPRHVGSAEWREFVQVYYRTPEAVCPVCLRILYRYTRFRADLVQVDRVHAHERDTG